MTFLEAASSGVVQGVTEFLPISSSGHLALLHGAFGFQEPKLLFDLTLHLGTTAAVVILFWRKISIILTQEKKQLFFVFLGSLPAAVAGLFLGKTVERFFTEPFVVGGGFFMTALWLFVGERFKPKAGRDLTWWSALLIGTSQAVAMIPGVSRSGATIATGLLCGLEGKFSVQFSFLLMIPAVVGAFLYKVLSAGGSTLDFSVLLGREGVLYMAGTLAAMGVGILAIQTILRTVERGRLSLFSLYLVGVGLATFFVFGKMR